MGKGTTGKFVNIYVLSACYMEALLIRFTEQRRSLLLSYIKVSESCNWNHISMLGGEVQVK